jgi:predicted transcriptional regulator
MDASTEEVVDAISSEDARTILRLADREPMSVQNLREELDASVATVYRRTDDLVDADLLKEETEITDDGDRYSTYETKIRSLTFTVEREQFRLDAQFRDDVVDRFSRMWRSLGDAQ